jgi:hypothetical protein
VFAYGAVDRRPGMQSSEEQLRRGCIAANDGGDLLGCETGDRVEALHVTRLSLLHKRSSMRLPNSDRTPLRRSKTNA